MADSEQQNTPIPSLAQQWSLQEKEQQPDLSEVPLGKTTEDTNPEDANPVEITSSDSAEEKSEETPVANESAVAEQTVEATEEVAEAAEEVEEAAEEQSEIKIETAPADFRFPTTNQTRHCFTRYIEYHRCIAAKGEDASECNKFAKYYRALCPGEWVDRWNEQRENGTFPGPL